MKRRHHAPKPRLPEGASYLSNGPVSTVFEWHGQTFRFAQGRRGGRIYRARPRVVGLVAEAATRRFRHRRWRYSWEFDKGDDR